MIHLKSDNKEIIINHKADEAVEELFELLLSRYQINFQESMKGSEFVFNYVSLLYYKYHKINPNCGGLCVDSPD